MEIKIKEDVGTLNVIALDRLGRKFTNCTAVRTTFDIKDGGIINKTYTENSYESIRSFVLDHQLLMLLKQ